MSKSRPRSMNYLALLVPLILSTILLAATQLAQQPTYLKPKIFVIGLSKTGTTSVGNALALLGYKRIGWKDIRSRHLVNTFVNGDLDALIEQTKYFDAFEDLPWPHLYRQMADMYPDAKFILSLRKDEQTWLRSMHRHMGRGTWQPAAYFYGAHEVEGNEEIILSAYRNHTTNVREFFGSQPHRYAELIVDDGDANWETLCRLAECPEGRLPTVPFPRSNTAAHWRDGSVTANLHWLWGWIISRIEELSTEYYYQRKSPFLNIILENVWRFINVIELACCEMYFKLAIQTQKPLPMA